MEGFIKRVVVDRGFGFVRIGGTTRELFFHVRDLDKALPFDERLTERLVQFEESETPKGPRAINVKPSSM